VNGRGARATPGPHSFLRRRVASGWSELRSSFGFPAGVAMLLAVVLGFELPALDERLDVELPLFAFDSTDSARSLLETVGTVTVSVAGLAFSVTLVAFTLTSSQLSPRVLRSFRTDRLAQTTLACFLATFVYCLVVLVRLGSTAELAAPDLSMTLAILLAFASFALFAAFISHIVETLQPSTIIAGIARDAASAVDERFPSGAGHEPEDRAAALAVVRRRTATPGQEIHARGEGYLSAVQGEALVAAAQEHDGLVRQCAPLGDYVVPGDVVAEVWVDADRADAFEDHVVHAFQLRRQRTPAQDIAFSVRQLADIALKGLSPGVNDPTTAENAMGALTAVLVRVAAAEPPAPVRADAEGNPRLVAHVPELDDLVRLGFEQVRVFAAPYPVVAARLVELLGRVGRVAERVGAPHAEVARQVALLRQGAHGRMPTEADERRVAGAHPRLRARVPAPGHRAAPQQFERSLADTADTAEEEHEGALAEGQDRAPRPSPGEAA